MKKTNYKAQGKKNRERGARFELRVRKYLEEKGGYFVDKWTNNVDLELNKLIKAKRKFNPFSKAMMLGAGFPDFIIFKLLPGYNRLYQIAAVECKSAKYLDKTEKAKCAWLLKNKVFDKIFIASKGKKRGEIIFKIFENENRPNSD